MPLLLLAALTLRAPNRTRGAWLALIPPLVLPPLLLWLLEQGGLAALFGFLSDSVAIFLFAVAMLWLLADKLGGPSRMTAAGYALLVVLAASVIGMFGVSSLSLGFILIPTGIVYGIMTAVFFAAMVFAAAACRKRYTSTRYLVWLFCILVFAIGCVLAFFSGLMTVISLLLMEGGLDVSYLFYSFVISLATGLAVGLAVFLLVLPFIALALWSPTFRPRFHAVFRLPGMCFEQEDAHNDESNGAGES